MDRMYKNWPRGLCGVLALAVVGGCAGSITNDAPISAIDTPGNTQVPLPAGEWKLLASKRSDAGRVLGGGIDNQHSVELEYGKVTGGMLTALAHVVTSADAPSTGGYGTGLPCIGQAPDDFLYFKDVRGSSINAIDCTRVIGNRVFNAPGARSSDLYREAYEKAKAFGGVPHNAVEVNFAEAHNLRFMNYTVWFFPERAGVPVRNAVWRNDQMAEPNRKFVADVVDWAKQFRNAVWLGVDYRL